MAHVLTYDNEVLHDAPRLYWPTNETAGTNIADLTRFGNDGTAAGSPTLNQTGPSSEIVGIQSDGTNDAVDSGKLAVLQDIGYPFTMEGWFKAPASTTSSTVYGRLTFNHPDSTSTNNLILVGMETDGSNNLHAVGDYKDTVYQNFDGGTTLTKDKWHHIVLLAKASNDYELYVNGYLDGTSTASENVLNTSNNPQVSLAHIRHSADTTSIFTAGYQAACAIYNYELSADRIRVHHAVGRGFNDLDMYGYHVMKNGPTLYWPTDETSGTTIADASGFGHDGTSAGTPTLNQTGPGTEKVISFDGTDDKVGLDGTGPIDEVIPGPYPYTDIVWMKTPSSTVASTVYGRSGVFNDGVADQFFACYMQTNSANDAVTVIFQARNTTAFNVTVSDVAQIGEYVMIAAVYTNATDRKYYINGALVGTDTNSVTFPTGADSIDIGVYDITSGPFFGAGFIGLRSIHPIALTEDKIRELHVFGRNWVEKTIDGVVREHAPRFYLKLDEVAGTNAADSGPFGTDFTHNGSPTLSSDGVTYNGTSHYTKLSSSVISDEGAPQTWSAILRAPASTSASTIYPFISSADESTTNNSMYMALVTDGSNNLAARGFLNNAGTNYTVESSAILTKDQDYYVHFVVASATDRRLYVNGVLMGTSTNSLAVPTVFDNCILGAQQRSSGLDYFQGTIRRPQVYGRELSETEIREQVSAWRGDFPGFVTLSSQTQNHAPMAYLELDETGGSTAADASPFAHDFTYAGTPTLTANGVTFDGTAGQEGQISKALELTAYPVTIMSIVKSPASTTSTNNYAITSAGDTSATTNFLYVGLETDGSNNLIAKARMRTGGTDRDITGATGMLKKDQFYMLHFVLRSATDREMYVNGYSVGTETTSTTFPATPNAVGIGTIPGSVDLNYAGTHQKAAFYQRELTVSEIRNQVAAWQGNSKKYGRKIHSFIPLAYFRLNEGSGTTFADKSGWGNDLTIAGTPTLNGAGPLFNDTEDGAFGDGDATNDEASTPTSFTMPTPAYPFALTGWIASPSTTVASTSYGRVHIGDDGSQSNTLGMDLIADGSNVDLEARQLWTSGGTSDHNTSAIPKERNVFHHFVYVARSATDREVYINGVSEITDATSATIPSGMDTVSLLRNLAASPAFFGGRNSEVAFHAHSFTDANALDLYLAAFEDQEKAIVTYNISVTDLITMSDTLKFVWQDSIADNIFFEDFATIAWLFSISDSITFTDSAVARLKFVESVADTIDMVTTVNAIKTAKPSVSDQIVFADVVNNRATLRESLADNISFVVSVRVAGETYTGIATNARHFGVTEYRDWDFTSMAEINGFEYGVSDSGFYEIGAETDDGAAVIATLKLAVLNQTGAAANIPEIQLFCRNTGRIVAKITHTEKDGTKKTNWYETNQTSDTLQKKRLKTKRGATSELWEVELTNIDGGAFDLDYVNMNIIDKRRRT